MCQDSTVWPSSSILNLVRDTGQRDKVGGPETPTINKNIPPKFTLSVCPPVVSKEIFICRGFAASDGSPENGHPIEWQPFTTQSLSSWRP